MSNTNGTTIDMSTAAGCEIMFKALKRMLKREDFPMTPDGWKMYCDHKIRKHTRFAAEEQATVAKWQSVREGEHMLEAMDKVADLQKALAKAAQLEKELAELKAKSQPKK